MASEHKHKPVEGVILNAAGQDSGDRWVSCKTCGQRLGIKQALPFGGPLPAYESLLTKVSE